MRLFRKILPHVSLGFEYPSENLSEVAMLYLETINFPFLKSELIEDIMAHPNYPSIHALTDVFQELGIPNGVIEVEENQITNIDVSFIAHFKKGELVFVESVSQNTVSYRKKRGKLLKASLEDFKTEWSRVAFFAEFSQTDIKNPSNPPTPEQEPKESRISDTLLALGFVGTIILFLGIQVMSSTVLTIPYILLFLIKLFGIALSVSVIMEKIGQETFASRYCNVGDNDCEKVINSSYNSLFGVIEWSHLPLLYFLGTLLLIIIIPNDLEAFSVVFLIHGVALIFIPFSLYVQKVLIKSWCPICLTIALTILLEFSIFMIYLDALNPGIPKPQVLLTVACIFLLVFFSQKIVLTQMKAIQSLRMERIQKLRFIKDPLVFETIGKKEKQIPQPNDSIGLIFGNPTANKKITEVISPFCTPCAEAYEKTNLLLERKEDVKLQCLFFVPAEKESEAYRIANRLIDIYRIEGPLSCKKALNDWFTTFNKDFEKWMRAFPVEGSTDNFEDIKRMMEWCMAHNISSTPTVVVNNHLFPRDYYGFDDLRYLL